MTLERAQQELRSCAGKQFDPQAIKALLAEIATPAVDKTASIASGNRLTPSRRALRMS
jgi:response regulator RpfG family c-di-GMP phosphodiesterase